MNACQATRRPGPCRAEGPGGFTLVELLVAIVVGSVVVCAEVSIFAVHGRVARRVQSELAASSGAAWALAVLARDFELAGTDPLQSGVVALHHAGRDRVVIDADLDGDGVVDPSSAERVTLSWTASGGGRLLRALGNQSMNIALGVPSAGFRIRYFDDAGTELPLGAGELDPADAARVRRVELELVLTETTPAAAATVDLRTAAALRSRLRGGA